LYYAYADALENTGKQGEARQWFDRAARLDGEGETDADERRDLLDGMLITFDDSDPEDLEAADAEGADSGEHRGWSGDSGEDTRR
jgi:hypothetical protein